jgi:hypothetical protein
MSVTAGTIFQDSHVPLTIWFHAMWQITSQKNGMSAWGLQRVLGRGSYKTAWAMRASTKKLFSCGLSSRRHSLLMQRGLQEPLGQPESLLDRRSLRHGVIMLRLAVRSFARQALRATQLLRTEILGAIQRHQRSSPSR